MSKHGKTRMSRTLVTGSEEDFDVICDLCNNDGQRVQATGHCIDCNENMCISCMKFHRKLPALQGHVIKDKSTLSQSQKAKRNVDKPAGDKDPMTDRCPKHPDELIKFYCNVHKALGCSDCISLDHRSCKDILYIKDVSGDVTNRGELTKIQADLQMLIARMSGTQSRTKWIKQVINDSYSQTVSDISKLKKEITDLLDKFEREMLEKASLMRNNEIGALDDTVSACESAIRKTGEILSDIEKKKVINHNNQLFISVKNAQSRILDLTDETEILCNKISYEHLSFQPDEQLQNLLLKMTGLGKMILVSQTKDVRAKYLHDINIKSDTDVENCGINASIVLPDGRLVLSDAYNKSVKLIDVTKRKVAEQIKLESEPVDFARVNSGSVVVTLENERYLQVLSLSPALSKRHTIAVNGSYYGIEHIPDKLILVCREPTSAVHICDMSGVVLQQIETDSGGDKLFTRASRIAISPDHGVMYVSDFQADTVVCLTMDGKLISKYANDSLQCPVGITVDDAGYVYVCSEDTDTIHQLSPSGKLVKILLKENDDTDSPIAIAYRSGNLYTNSAREEPVYQNSTKVYRLQK